MAGIYIPGMDMPTKAKDEVITIYPDGTVLKYSLDSDFHNAKSRAVEVPPHGRLGDLDKLERMFADIDNAPYSGFDGAEPFYSADDAAQIIRLAPTIIPASKEGA